MRALVSNLHPRYKIVHMLRDHTRALNLYSSFSLTFVLQINRRKFEHHCFFQNRIFDHDD